MWRVGCDNRWMAIPPAPPGWSRLQVKSKFGAGRDFAVTDLAGAQVFFVDGKVGTRPKAEIRDAAGATVARVRGRLLGVPKRMEILAPDGAALASLKAAMFSPIKSRMTLTAADGREWNLEGSFLEKEYSIASEGRPVALITQKWVTVRDAYTLDVADGVDVALALAVLWAVDRWVERD